MTKDYIILNNGLKMPKLGYGTIMQFGEQIENNVIYALQNGYSLIDTANRYGNEVEVGRAIKKSGIPRDKIFLETKLGPTLYENDQAIDDTLKRLDVDYIDLMLLHHPVNNYIYAYKMLEKAYKEGKLKAIGISNFPVDKIQEILDQCEIVPSLMQCECHPYYPAEHVQSFLKDKGIALQAWYPLGHGNIGLMNNEVITSLSHKYQKSSAQIVLRWHLQKGFGFVPGSKSYGHIKENAEIFDFELNDDEIKAIDALNTHEPIYKVTSESLHRLATTKCNFEE